MTNNIVCDVCRRHARELQTEKFEHVFVNLIFCAAPLDRIRFVRTGLTRKPSFSYRLKSLGDLPHARDDSRPFKYIDTNK